MGSCHPAYRQNKGAAMAVRAAERPVIFAPDSVSLVVACRRHLCWSVVAGLASTVGGLSAAAVIARHSRRAFSPFARGPGFSAETKWRRPRRPASFRPDAGAFGRADPAGLRAGPGRTGRPAVSLRERGGQGPAPAAALGGAVDHGDPRSRRDLLGLEEALFGRRRGARRLADRGVSRSASGEPDFAASDAGGRAISTRTAPGSAHASARRDRNPPQRVHARATSSPTPATSCGRLWLRSLASSRPCEVTRRTTGGARSLPRHHACSGRAHAQADRRPDEPLAHRTFGTHSTGGPSGRRPRRQGRHRRAWPSGRRAGCRIDFQRHPNAGRRRIGDRDQLAQVAQNLIENAIKYTPRGRRGERQSRRLESRLVSAAAHQAAGRPHVASHPRPGRGAALCRLAGARPRSRHRPQSPAPADRTLLSGRGTEGEGRPGTGLGLAIVKHIVNRHRGGLAVESVVGAGSVFTVYVPLAETLARRPAAPPDRSAGLIVRIARTPGCARGAPMNILLVGSGGREHALAWKIAQSPLVTRLVCAPGNPGIAALCEMRPVAADDVDGQVALAAEMRRRPCGDRAGVRASRRAWPTGWRRPASPASAPAPPPAGSRPPRPSPRRFAARHGLPTAAPRRLRRRRRSQGRARRLHRALS